MRVGITSSEPWAEAGGEPRGVEPELIRRFAANQRARIDWVDGSEEELMAALKERQLDVVVGGLTNETPWKTEAALTRPYVTTRLVVGARASDDLPDDLSGARVAFERGTEAGGLVERKTDATAVPVDDLKGVRGPAAVPQWLLDDLGLEPTDVELKADKHVMATPLGENAWLVRLERFLLSHERDVQLLLESEGRP